MKLYCAKCGAPLSRSCELAGLERYDAKANSETASVTAGFIVVLPHADYLQIENAKGRIKKRKASSASAYALNPSDVERQQLKSAGIDNGCCGSDGLDGFNRKCLCGAVLGTEWSDCWTQAEVRFEPAAVRLD